MSCSAEHLKQQDFKKVQVLLPLPCQKALKALCFQGFLLFLGVSQIRPKTAKYGIKVCQKCVRKKEGFPSFFYQFYFLYTSFRFMSTWASSPRVTWDLGRVPSMMPASLASCMGRFSQVAFCAAFSASYCCI